MQEGSSVDSQYASIHEVLSTPKVRTTSSVGTEEHCSFDIETNRPTDFLALTGRDEDLYISEHVKK
jgi:hypothetical protein